MSSFEIAAAAFLFIQLLKFIWGSVAERVQGLPEMDSFAELMVAILVALLIGATNDGVTKGDIALGAAVGFFTSTVWAALQLWRMRQLFSITRGMR